MRLDWTGESVGRMVAQEVGARSSFTQWQACLPPLGDGVWEAHPHKRSRRARRADGLGTVTFQRVTVPTRRLQPTVTGDEVRFESLGTYCTNKTQQVLIPSALVGKMGDMGMLGPSLGVFRGKNVKQVYGMGYYWAG